MYRILKTIVGLVSGAIWGGIVGAIMLAVPTYFDDGAPPFGGRGWVIIGVYMGLMLGAIPGAIIGLAVGASSLNKPKGAGVGAFVGSIVMVVLFFMGAAGDTLVSAWAVLSVPAGAVVGVIASTLVGWSGRSKKVDFLG